MWQQGQIRISTRGMGLEEITGGVGRFVAQSGIETGLVHVFCRHTSCSLVLMENADPTAKRDLEGWLDRLVDPHDPHFEHTLEGLDDMPSHIKMALTRSQETLPIVGGSLGLGTWQGLFLWEHRARPHTRSLVLTAHGEAG